MVQQNLLNTANEVSMRTLERKITSLEKERDSLKEKNKVLEIKNKDLEKEVEEKEKEKATLEKEKEKIEQELLLQRTKDGNARFVAILVFIASILTELMPLIFKAMGWIVTP